MHFLRSSQQGMAGEGACRVARDIAKYQICHALTSRVQCNTSGQHSSWQRQQNGWHSLWNVGHPGQGGAGQGRAGQLIMCKQAAGGWTKQGGQVFIAARHASQRVCTRSWSILEEGDCWSVGDVGKVEGGQGLVQQAEGGGTGAWRGVLWGILCQRRGPSQGSAPLKQPLLHTTTPTTEHGHL